MIIWIIGLSGAGKTTIGTPLYKQLKSFGKPWFFMDGDIFRNIMGNDLGHTIEDRRKNAIRINNFCLALEEQSINVVCSVLSIFPEYQTFMRENATCFFQIYLKVDFDRLVKNDTKGLYEKALNGKLKNVVGVDIPFPDPIKSDFIFNNNFQVDPQEIVNEICPIILDKLNA